MFDPKTKKLFEIHKKLHKLGTDLFWLSYSEEKEILSDDDKNRLEKKIDEEKKLKENSNQLIKDLQNNHNASFSQKLNEIITKYAKVSSFLEKQNLYNNENKADRDFCIYSIASLNDLTEGKYSDINLYWAEETAKNFIKKYSI